MKITHFVKIVKIQVIYLTMLGLFGLSVSAFSAESTKDSSTDSVKDSTNDLVKQEKGEKVEQSGRLQGDWKQLFDGKTLENWEVPPVGGEGPVEIKGKDISIGMGVGITAIRYTKENMPKWDYEVVYEARRKMGHDFFGALTFPVGEDHCTFINGGWGGGTIGLSCIDGRDASDNGTSGYFRFDSKYWYQFRVRVLQGRIMVWIKKLEVAENEKVLASETELVKSDVDPNDPVIDFLIADHKIGLRYETSDMKPLGLATWITEGLIRRIDCRELTPEEIAQSAKETEELQKKYGR
ncbi:MAG: hypothetical protein ACRC10_07245 [Thermoguttaceae bacterium]